ncbi:MAG TPA: hypothetical protein PL078_02200 [Bacillota bacterium]|jgi:hypothetical protein|nr:hypothetical protein [Bacillota bacterium]HQD75331.1 hypothetical protein [Bacillota bacterium]HUM58077.1 hypothetical protein [Bacillota bacterium]
MARLAAFVAQEETWPVGKIPYDIKGPFGQVASKKGATRMVQVP